MKRGRPQKEKTTIKANPETSEDIKSLRSGQGNTRKPEPKFRDWVFTSFDENPPAFDELIMKYLAYNQETCPTTKRKHYQGFVYFKNQHSLKGVKKIIGNSPHLEVMRGNLEQNNKYCSKEGGLTVFGQPPSQGARSDLLELRDKIKKGVRVEEITMDNPMIFHQYGRTLEKVEDIYLRSQYRTETTKGYWIYGPTGSGKSHWAYTRFGDYNPDKYYNAPKDKGWWDNYRGQEVVVINDFRGHIPYDDLLQMVDKWPYEVPRRGRPPCPFVSKVVVITSPLTPEEVYNRRNTNDGIEQLLRRFEIIHLDVPHTPGNG